MVTPSSRNGGLSTRFGLAAIPCTSPGTHMFVTWEVKENKMIAVHSW
jgi:hypothetical protein